MIGWRGGDTGVNGMVRLVLANRMCLVRYGRRLALPLVVALRFARRYRKGD